MVQRNEHNFQSMSLYSCAMSRQTVARLVDVLQLPSMVSFGYSNNELGEEDGASMVLVRGLAGLTTLQSLEFSHDLDEDEDAAFASSLERLTSLLRVCLRGYEYGDSEGQLVCHALESLTGLTSLDLSSNSIWEGGCVGNTCRALKVLTLLSTLNLSGNEFGDGGIVLVCRQLETLTALTTVDLSNMDFTKRGAADLCLALTALSHLVTLNLSDNAFGCEGVVGLSTALRNLTMLTSLNLSGIGIKEQGATSLSQTLMVLTRLVFLDLSKNQCRPAGIRLLAQAIFAMSALHTLSLSLLVPAVGASYQHIQENVV